MKKLWKNLWKSEDQVLGVLRKIMLSFSDKFGDLKWLKVNVGYPAIRLWKEQWSFS